ncbi:DUF3383 family protein [bacterium]|nr:DUF3383 family protein [bacterium]
MALSLNDIIDVKINITKATPTGRQFDLLLLVGETDVFSDRIKIYKDTYSMLQDGFLSSDRLYKACQLAFSQSQHPARIAIGRIGNVNQANTAGEGEILLADALELNASAEVGKYIYSSESTSSVDEYRLSDTAVEGGQLIVSDTIPNDEILLEDALELNAEAEVGQYLYSSVVSSPYLLSEYQETGSKLIVPDAIPDDKILLTTITNNLNGEYALNKFYENDYDSVASGKYIYKYYLLYNEQTQGCVEVVADENKDMVNEKYGVTYVRSRYNPDAQVGQWTGGSWKYKISNTAVTSYTKANCKLIVSEYPDSTTEISLTDALELNADAQVGLYIYENEFGTISYSGGNNLLSSTPVENGRLIVASYPHSNAEITLTSAQALNANAEVDKYIYHYQVEGNTGGYLLSDTAVEGGQLIVADTILRKETVEEVLTACRAENDEWYIVNFCKDMTDNEHITAGQFCENCSPSAIYAFTTNDSTTLTVNENIFTKLKALKLQRTIGQYSTEHQDSIVAILSWALKLLSTDRANNAFTLKDKIEEGVTPETNINSASVKTLKENNGNIYVKRNGFTLFEDGKMANGDFFDEVAFLDKYKERMQINIIQEMQKSNKIKQTEDGMTILKAKITEVCEDMYANGFIDSGVWKAEPVLNLQTGDTLTNGYYIQSEPIDEQSQSDREARIAPPIYVSLKLAGAIHYLTIQIDVNR